MWIDPDHELFFIFLSNRVHPDGNGDVNRLAGRMATVAVSAIDDELLQSKQAMVKPGIDVLAESTFESLKGKVGLITNQTGVSRTGKSTIQILREAPAVNLVALFSPEHGLAGKLDQSIIGDGIDEQSKLKVYSLYGKNRQPTEEQLAEIDTLVFDIQDIGCRFYTYISTMGLAMQAAAAHGKKFVILDRPNPIGGVSVGGSLPDLESESFVNFHPIPIRHGMTVGELALMFKEELKLKELDLHVVRCSGWSRHLYFDQTGLSWINPSPNMRNVNQAILYPGIGLWETTNLSVGRGTDTPFEIVGAPWINERELATELNAAQLPGVLFTPRRFVPGSSKFKAEECGGIQISITDREELEPIRCGVTLACSLRKLYRDKWDLEKCSTLLCNRDVLDLIRDGSAPDEVMNRLDSDAESFSSRRLKHLLYK
jgi:uncharacterized protein YbbC (DUF1343 family)